MTTRLHSDRTLRKSLHDLYVALFHARKASPVEFHDSKTTTVFTAVMGLESLTWRVVGITSEALDLLAKVDFDKAKLPRKLCRGHIRVSFPRNFVFQEMGYNAPVNWKEK